MNSTGKSAGVHERTSVESPIFRSGKRYLPLKTVSGPKRLSAMPSPYPLPCVQGRRIGAARRHRHNRPPPISAVRLGIPALLRFVASGNPCPETIPVDAFRFDSDLGIWINPGSVVRLFRRGCHRAGDA